MGDPLGIPQATELNEELLRLVPERIPESSTFEPHNLEEALVASFLAKAFKTTKAITVLAQEGLGEDAAMLTRSLLNLTINALWIHQEPEDRSLAYVDYDSVLRARLARKIVENPSVLGTSGRKEVPNIKRMLPELEANEKSVTITHGYTSRGWSGKTIRQMAADVDMVSDYDSAYTLTSNLEHSNARGINSYVLGEAEGRFKLRLRPSSNYVRESLLTACHLFLVILNLADKVLTLNLEADLKNAQARLIAL